MSIPRKVKICVQKLLTVLLGDSNLGDQLVDLGEVGARLVMGLIGGVEHLLGLGLLGLGMPELVLGDLKTLLEGGAELLLGLVILGVLGALDGLDEVGNAPEDVLDGAADAADDLVHCLVDVVAGG